MIKLPFLYSYKKVEKILRFITVFIHSNFSKLCFRPTSAKILFSSGGFPQRLTGVSRWKSTSLSSNTLEKHLPTSHGAFAKTSLISVKPKLFPMGLGTCLSNPLLVQGTDAWTPAVWPTEGTSTARPALTPAPLAIYPTAARLSDHGCSGDRFWVLMQVQCNDEDSKHRPTQPRFTCQPVPGNIPQF